MLHGLYCGRRHQDTLRSDPPAGLGRTPLTKEAAPVCGPAQGGAQGASATETQVARISS